MFRFTLRFFFLSGEGGMVVKFDVWNKCRNKFIFSLQEMFLESSAWNFLFSGNCLNISGPRQVIVAMTMCSKNGFICFSVRPKNSASADIVRELDTKPSKGVLSRIL